MTHRLLALTALAPLAALATLVALVAFAGGCASAPRAPTLSSSSLSHRAHKDLGCPAHQVEVEVADSSSSAEARGCGRRLVYAPSCPPGSDAETAQSCTWQPLESP